MGCNIKSFRDKKIKEVIALVHNPSAIAYRLHNKNSIIITPKSGSKIKTPNQAFRAAEAMEKKIAKEFGKDYKFDIYGKWTTIYKSPTDVRIEVNIPNNLLKAYQAKENKKVNNAYATDTATHEQSKKDSNEFFEMPFTLTNKEDQINSKEFINYKTQLIYRAEDKIKDLQAQRKQKYTSALSSRINTLNNLKEKLLQDIKEVQKANDIVRVMESQISSDLVTLTDLLEGKTSIEDIHSAEEIISFYTTITNYQSNTKSKFLILDQIYDANKKLVLDSEIKDLLDSTLIAMNEMNSKLSNKKRAYLQELIDNSEQIQALQEARRKEDATVGEFEIEELLKDFEDITWWDENFLTLDKQFSQADSLLAQLMKIELELRRSNEKSHSSDLVKRIDEALERATPALNKLTNPVRALFGTITNRDFSPFYRKSALGNITGVLVSKFSENWDTAKKRLFYRTNLERRKGGEEDINRANKMEYDWIDSNANFLDITKIPAIIRDPQFMGYIEEIDEAAAEIYEQELIEELGQEFYDRLVAEQISNLRDFDSVSSRFQAKDSPFFLLKSKKAGYEGKGFINSREINIGTKYNSYYPKKQIEVLENNTVKTIDSGYYDKDFDSIEQNADLLNLWKAFEAGAEYINDTVTDGRTRLQHGSVLAMEKSFSEILLNKSNKGRKVEISEWLKRNLKSYVTQNKSQKNASEEVTINKTQFKTNEGKIKTMLTTFSMKLKRVHGIANNEPLDLLTVPQEVLDFFKEELNTSASRLDLIDTIGTDSITPYDLSKLYITDQVTEENSLDLPVTMRAYIEMTAEYKAQKDSQPKIEIYKQFYDNIQKKKIGKAKEDTAKEAIEDKRKENIVDLDRTKAKKRVNYWYNKNVKGTVDSTKPLVIITDTYVAYEEAYKEELELQMQDPSISAEQVEKIQNEIDQIGMNITLAAAVNSAIIKVSLFKGLAFSVKAAIINKFQGWFQGAVNDGRFWTEGNFDIANNFITRKVLRFSPLHKTFKQEMEKTKLMINALNILQDATNEIDRARDKSGVRGMKKILSPFYLTEYTEWHNQTPQILSMLMDNPIEDKDGNIVQVFDGKSFPAHEIKNGFLVLKPEFAEKEGNTETWQNFSNDEAANNKLYMSEVIGNINGDYSKTGGIKAKKNFWGRSAMLFKSWLPNYVWNRVASNQANLILGKPEVKGIYTSHRKGTLGLLLGTSGLLALGVPGLIAGIAIGAVAASFIKKNNDPTNMLEDVGMLQESATIGLALLKRLGAPVNLITGKNLWKGKHDLSNITVSKEDAQNLNAILTEITVLLTLALFKILVKGALGPNDEEEPKSIKYVKDNENPYYFENIQSDEEQMMHNLLENQISRLIGDIVGIQSGQYYLDIHKNFQVARTLEEVYKVADGVYALSQGKDRINQGINTGDSRLGNASKNLLLPGIFKSPLSLGFTTSMEQEYNKKEFFDSYFFSDYKKDRAARDVERRVLKADYTEELKVNMNYEDADKKAQKIMLDIISNIATKFAEIQLPYPPRILYDKEQKKVEPKK